MHRSDTSSVAGTLVKLGAAAPNSLHVVNHGGAGEDRSATSLAAFNGELLASAGSTWDDWRPFDVSWYDSAAAAAFKERARQLLFTEFGHSRLFVLADPRVARVARFWLEVLVQEGIEPKVVLPLSSPVEVARAHWKDDGFAYSKGVILWLRHVLDAEAFSRTFSRTIFAWNAFLDGRLECLERISLELGVDFPARPGLTVAETDELVGGELTHAAVAASELPDHSQLHPWVQTAHAALLALAKDPKSEKSLASLDAVRTRFDEATRLFGGALAEAAQDHPRAVSSFNARPYGANRSIEAPDEQSAGGHDNHGDIIRLEAEIARFRAEYDRVDRERAQNAERARRLESSISALEAVKDEQDIALEILRARYDALELSTSQILSSKSWRWTAASRELFGFLDRLRHRSLGESARIKRSSLRRVGRYVEKIPPPLRRLAPRAVRDRLRTAIFPPAMGSTTGSRDVASLYGGVASVTGPGSGYRAKRGPTILFVSHDANRGGAPVVLASIASWFQRHTDFDVKIVCVRGGPSLSLFEAIGPTMVLDSNALRPDRTNEYHEAVRDFAGINWKFAFVNTVAAGDFLQFVPPDITVFSFLHEMERIIALFEPQFEKICERSKLVFCASDAVKEAVIARRPEADGLLQVRESFITPPQTKEFLTAAAKRLKRLRMGLTSGQRLVVGCGTVHWRKQPDVFLRLAQTISASRSDVIFIWIGDGEDLDLLRLQAKGSASGAIQFIGHQDNVADYLEAADVFVLPSLEDPFPLVCLEAAAASTPSVIFREAGGMVSFVEPLTEPPAGVAVTLGDEASLLNAVGDLLADDSRWDAMSRTGYERVRRRYFADQACADILRSIRLVTQTPPRVSIVVPSYNCGQYLRQRLESIAAQTFRDVEVLLLDDNSTDDSLEILNEAALGRPNWRVYPSDTNSGSAFRAWKRGISLAHGDLIWIAEADDFCEPDFLETMLSAFDVSGTRIAHGRSFPVTSNGQIAGDYNDVYLNRIANGRWASSYSLPARSAVSVGLGRANTIPNASAVIVTREAAIYASEIAVDFRLAGDWAFYLAAAYGGKIAYVHEAVNFHRRHETTITKALEGSPKYFQEFANVNKIIEHLYGRDSARESAAREFVAEERARFNASGSDFVGELPTALQGRRPLTVLYGVGDLSGGGAQMFALRFVEGLHQHGQRAILFTCDREPDHPAVASQLPASVPRVSATDIEKVGLSRFCSDWGVDLIVTGHWWADHAVAHWLERQPGSAPWVVVMHGCHENVLSHKQYFNDFDKTMKLMERHVDHWVWTAPKNQEVFDRRIVRPRSLSHIVSGFRPSTVPNASREWLGIKPSALVFTLASRAIEEKGWFVALEALELLLGRIEDEQELLLILVGDGPVMEKLQGGRQPAGVRLIRHTSRLDEVIAASDVCLLPSWFAGESLPLTVIEFLAQGKPAIVSDIGMCPWAIDSDSDAAGIVVPRQKDGRVNPEVLAEAMLRMIRDVSFLERCSLNARQAFRKFDFDTMMNTYLELARQVVGEARNSSRKDDEFSQGRTND